MKYYILTGVHSHLLKFPQGKERNAIELIFGDYDRELVEAEKEHVASSPSWDDGGYKRLKIHALSSDTQAAIDAKLEQLNS